MVATHQHTGVSCARSSHHTPRLGVKDLPVSCKLAKEHQHAASRVWVGHLLRIATSDSNAFSEELLPICAACSTFTATSWPLKVPA